MPAAATAPKNLMAMLILVFPFGNPADLKRSRDFASPIHIGFALVDGFLNRSGAFLRTPPGR
jgi:hypothetical protein